MHAPSPGGSLLDQIVPSSLPLTDRAAETWIDSLIQSVSAEPDRAKLAAALGLDAARRLLAGIASGSPYLKGKMERDAARLERVLLSDPERHIEALIVELRSAMATVADFAEAMALVRRFKAEVALLTALADLGGVWPIMTVTGALTRTADVALELGVAFLFRQAVARGDWLASDADVAAGTSGYIVLAMGKHGAGELNYSSDIDLIIFYDLDRARLKEGLEPQPFFVRLTRDLVRFMDERTRDGYVFRTDLRLRPDAGATQVAMSTDAALIYYESFGQNWERAALIKARPVAGDLEAGQLLLDDLQPFIWRRYLDFAAISDIHAMKRQIHAFRGLGGIGVAGHNVKLGRGGIREIEFFAQTQQLIAGGRQKDLRVRRTLDALAGLAERGWIKPGVRDRLSDAYKYLRRIEHRVQMVADEQTHELPEQPDALERFSRFAGYETAEAFSAAYRKVLETVERHYAELFEATPELTAAGSNMVFAGEADDPGTVAALTALGFSQPSEVLAAVRGWHHGRYPAVRTPRARERLTEVQPLLISALAETASPDQAFAAFDRFLSELPSGVQVFSLLRANPNLMRLVADIMGTAPRLARVLSRRQRLLDAVLDPRTFAPLPAAAEIDRVIAADLTGATDMQDVLDRARLIGNEQSFLIGVKILSGTINANQAGEAYAILAERLIMALHDAVTADMERQHGKVPGGEAVVVAMGKLGGREMTAASDLDLMVIYDFDQDALQSDGERPLAPSQYFARLTQRLITALTAQTAEGPLYEVDLRLRPSGQKGPLATQIASFVSYQATEAWTWEHMALTRARVVSGPDRLSKRVDAAIHETLVRVRDRRKIAADVKDMRGRIATEKGTDNIWDLKQVRGGLVDIEFIAQYLQLVAANGAPSVLDTNTIAALHKLAEAGVLPLADAEALIGTARTINDLGQITRLCQEGPFNPDKAPKGLKDLAARAGAAPSFEALEAGLKDALAASAARFESLIA